MIFDNAIREGVERGVKRALANAQKKGPAEAATSPSRGSQSLTGKSNMDTTSTSRSKAASDELWDRAWDLLNQIETKLLRVKSLNEMMWMAGEGLADLDKKNAITAQCDVMDEALREALDARAEVSSMVLGRVPA